MSASERLQQQGSVLRKYLVVGAETDFGKQKPDHATTHRFRFALPLLLTAGKVSNQVSPFYEFCHPFLYTCTLRCSRVYFIGIQVSDRGHANGRFVTHSWINHCAWSLQFWCSNVSWKTTSPNHCQCTAMCVPIFDSCYCEALSQRVKSDALMYLLSN